MIVKDSYGSKQEGLEKPYVCAQPINTESTSVPTITDSDNIYGGNPDDKFMYLIQLFKLSGADDLSFRLQTLHHLKEQ